MQRSSRSLPVLLTALIAIGALAGLYAAKERFRAEVANRAIEVGLEWAEVSDLAQVNPRHVPLATILERFRLHGASTLIIGEDTLGSLELSGAVRTERPVSPDGRSGTRVLLDSPATLQRVRTALQAHGIRTYESATETYESPAVRFPSPASTAFVVRTNKDQAAATQAVSTPVDYANLRSLGIGLPPDAVAAAQAAHYRIAGRIGNFAGVTKTSAEQVLRNLHAQGASLVIFNGDEVLGYRGVEKDVAELLRPDNNGVTPVGIYYGAVEFGKQKGDEKLSAQLHGDYIRVHSIQAAEMGQLDENEAIERFVRAARERNIRFCYVRLLTFSGDDPVSDNEQFLRKICAGTDRLSGIIGGTFRFRPAHLFGETRVPKAVFALLGLGAAAGFVWMLGALCPLPESKQTALLIVLGLVSAALAFAGGEMGRKLVALLAGIAYPAVACLVTYPSVRSAKARSRSAVECLAPAVSGLIRASAITGIGVVYVVGLLATRPFMLRANQFLGIKAQHAVPLLIVAFAAMVGGAALPKESWAGYRARVKNYLRSIWNEPARIGLLVVGVIALAGFALVVARTGNEPGVGVSGIELKFRSVLDRTLPVRPRTKEFLLGHPAFVLALAWWLRGRRKPAIPLFVLGSLGQVSLLNTFCHIHTPLLVSVWHAVTGLILGSILGIAVFLLLERFLPPVNPDAPAPQSDSP